MSPWWSGKTVHLQSVFPFALPSRWTRREEADFYRVVSTFGVVFDPDRAQFDWTKFRAMARLHKKTDESLEKYLYAFMAMCRRVCRLPSKDGGLLIILSPPPKKKERKNILGAITKHILKKLPYDRNPTS